MSYQLAQLVAPSSDRGYAGAAARLAAAELAAFGDTVLGTRPRGPAPVPRADPAHRVDQGITRDLLVATT